MSQGQSSAASPREHISHAADGVLQLPNSIQVCVCPLQKSNSTETDKAGGDTAENEGTSRLTGRMSGTPSAADRDLDADAAALEAEKKRWAPRAQASCVRIVLRCCCTKVQCIESLYGGSLAGPAADESVWVTRALTGLKAKSSWVPRSQPASLPCNSVQAAV